MDTESEDPHRDARRMPGGTRALSISERCNGPLVRLGSCMLLNDLGRGNLYTSSFSPGSGETFFMSKFSNFIIFIIVIVDVNNGMTVVTIGSSGRPGQFFSLYRA